MTKRPDDAEFCDKLISGDVEAFRQFFRQRSPEVLALCQKVLRNTQDAEDVTADVFLEVWSHRDRFDPERGNLRGYVLMLARCRAIDLYRSKAKLRARGDGPVATGEIPGEVKTTPHEDVTMTEFRQLANLALAQIGEEERTAIELSIFEGLSHSQIANRLDSPLGTIKSHIRRGIAKLKQQLKQWEA